MEIIATMMGSQGIDEFKSMTKAALNLGVTPVEKCLPVITVLTLAATGSEMDVGGVISKS